MKIILSIAIGAFVVIGILLSLISIYATADGQAHYLEASYFWIGSAVAIFAMVMLLKKTD